MLEMFTSFKSLSSSPVSIDFCKMVCRIGARLVAYSFRIQFGILWGPDALLMFTLSCSFSSPFTVIFYCCFVLFVLLMVICCLMIW